MKLGNKNERFIREFSDISVASICRDLNIDNTNIYKKYGRKNIDKVKKEIDKKIVKLYDNYVNAGDDDE